MYRVIFCRFSTLRASTRSAVKGLVAEVKKPQKSSSKRTTKKTEREKKLEKKKKVKKVKKQPKIILNLFFCSNLHKKKKKKLVS